MPEASPSHSPAGPLKGLKAIELGSTVAGPFCGRLLADFGCDVIKVEQAEGDAVRSLSHRHKGKSLYNASIQRGKRIISLNLRTEKGRELVKQLCRSADIVIENFRPGTLEKWGLGYDVLSADNPGLVMVRVSGFGQSGPYSGRAGYGIVCEAVSGLREITGDPDRPPPRSGTPMTDYIAGLYAAFGTSMAIIERQRTGRGQIVDTALYEGAFTLMESHIPTFQQLGIVAERAGSQLPGNAPNSVYPTRDGGYVLIAAAADAVFRRLADVIDRPDMKEDPRFAAAIPRAENMQACDEAVTAWTSQHDMADIERQLEEAGVPASRIFTVADIFEDPHYQARDMLVDVEDDDLGPVTLTGIVPKLSETPGHIRWTGRETGADTTSVLIEELGLDQAEIDDLADQGIVAGPSFSKTNK